MSHTFSETLSNLENRIISRRSGTISEEVIVVNGIDVRIRLSLKCELDEIHLTVYLRPNTCEVFDQIDVEATCGFLNTNGNMCQKGNIKHQFNVSDTMLHGVTFYHINKRDMGKIKQYYSVIRGDISYVDIRVLISKCSTHAHHDRLLKAIYLQGNARTVERLQNELSVLRDAFIATEERNSILVTQLADLASIQRPVAELASTTQPQAQTQPQPHSPSIDDMIGKLDLEGLSILADKISEKIQDIRRCKICLGAMSVVTIMPCRHTCMCSTCSEQYKNNTCPICRTNIVDRIKVYM